ncbi:MAG: hypothetical protein RLZZ124_24, partial [Cyanobacteriota bacterium]
MSLHQFVLLALSYSIMCAIILWMAS